MSVQSNRLFFGDSHILDNKLNLLPPIPHIDADPAREVEWVARMIDQPSEAKADRFAAIDECLEMLSFIPDSANSTEMYVFQEERRFRIALTERLQAPQCVREGKCDMG